MATHQPADPKTSGTAATDSAAPVAPVAPSIVRKVKQSTRGEIIDAAKRLVLSKGALPVLAEGEALARDMFGRDARLAEHVAEIVADAAKHAERVIGFLGYARP